MFENLTLTQRRDRRHRQRARQPADRNDRRQPAHGAVGATPCRRPGATTPTSSTMPPTVLDNARRHRHGAGRLHLHPGRHTSRNLTLTGSPALDGFGQLAQPTLSATAPTTASTASPAATPWPAAWQRHYTVDQTGDVNQRDHQRRSRQGAELGDYTLPLRREPDADPGSASITGTGEELPTP